MRFTINHSLLLENLNCVSRAISTKTPMPILTGIKIDVRFSGLTLTASNSDISIQTVISDPRLKVEEEGVIVVPGKYFLDIVRKAEAEDLEFITFEGNTVKILANKSNFTLISMDHSSYPLISFSDSDTFMTLDTLNLKQLVRKTSFSASLTETRLILTGVSFNATGSKLEAVATDSYRLSKKHMAFEKEFPSISVVIPSKSLDELAKIIEDNQGSVEMHVAPSKVLFKYKNILFQTRLIEGKYPDTSVIIPSKFLNSVTFNKNDLINAIERASLFSNIEGNNIIKMDIQADNVKISSTNSEIGAAIEEVSVLSQTNNYPLQLAFSSKFFLEAAKSFDDSEITIHFTGEIKPFIITSQHDYNLIQLILPVRAS